MSDKLVSFIKAWNIPIAALATGILVVIYLGRALTKEPAPTLGDIQQTLATVIFNSFTMVGSLFAFGLVVFMKDEGKWGDASHATGK